MNAIIQSILDIILTLRPDLQIAYLFGNFAQGKQIADGDIDIAILTAEKISAVEHQELTRKIAQVINREVNLVDLHETATVMCYQIVGYGKCIYCINENFCAQFEMRAIAAQLHFNEEKN